MQDARRATLSDAAPQDHRSGPSTALRLTEQGREVLRIAGAVEALSEHPIARAVASAASALGPSTQGSSAPASSTPGGPSAVSLAADDTDGQPTVGGDGVGIGASQVLEFRNDAGRGVSGVVRIAHSGNASKLVNDVALPSLRLRVSA